MSEGRVAAGLDYGGGKTALRLLQPKGIRPNSAFWNT